MSTKFGECVQIRLKYSDQYTHVIKKIKNIHEKIQISNQTSKLSLEILSRDTVLKVCRLHSLGGFEEVVNFSQYSPVF